MTSVALVIWICGFPRRNGLGQETLDTVQWEMSWRVAGTKWMYCIVIGMADWRHIRKEEEDVEEFFAELLYWCTDAKVIKVVALFDIILHRLLMFLSAHPLTNDSSSRGEILLLLLLASWWWSFCDSLGACVWHAAGLNESPASSGRISTVCDSSDGSKGKDRKHHNHVGMN